MELSKLFNKLNDSELNSVKSTLDSIIQERYNVAIKIGNLKLSNRAYNVLNENDLTDLKQISKLTIEQFKKYNNVGKKTIDEVSLRLEKHGLEWASDARLWNLKN